MKKNWLLVKRGLVCDPKHRAAMGECIWLYQYMLDRADWETGVIYDWVDRVEAKQIQMAEATLRWQRRRLAELGYITCVRKRYSSDIVIHLWINPRDYSSRILHPKGKPVGKIENGYETDNGLSVSASQTDNENDLGVVGPTSNSKTITSEEEQVPEILALFDKAAVDIFPNERGTWLRWRKKMEHGSFERRDGHIVVKDLKYDDALFLQDRLKAAMQRALTGVINESVQIDFYAIETEAK